jgi:hypothetical protein
MESTGYTFNANQKWQFNQMVNKFEKMAKFLKMEHYYTAFQKSYLADINKKLKLLSIEVVVYDETEFFRDYDDPNFSYPFEKRKNLLTSFKFQIPDYLDTDEETGEYTMEDYQIKYTNIKFMRAETCLEGNYM